MEISRSRIVGIAFSALFVFIGAFAVYRSGVIDVEERHPWDDPAFAAPRGEAAAHRDIKDGARSLALYGYVLNPEPTKSKLRNFGYSPNFRGCGTGGSQYKYWHAYNLVMIEAGRAQFGERFVAEVTPFFWLER